MSAALTRRVAALTDGRPQLFSRRLDGRHAGSVVVELSRLYGIDRGLFEALFADAAGVLGSTTDESICDPPEALRANIARVAEAEARGLPVECPVRLPVALDPRGVVQGLLVLSPLLTEAHEAVVMIDNACVRRESWGRGVLKALAQFILPCARWALSLGEFDPVITASEYAWLDPDEPLDHTEQAIQHFARIRGYEGTLCVDREGRLTALPYEAPEPSGEASTPCCLVLTTRPDVPQLGRVTDALLDSYLHMGEGAYDPAQVEHLRRRLRRRLAETCSLRYVSWAEASAIRAAPG